MFDVQAVLTCKCHWFIVHSAVYVCCSDLSAVIPKQNLRIIDAVFIFIPLLQRWLDPLKTIKKQIRGNNYETVVIFVELMVYVWITLTQFMSTISRETVIVPHALFIIDYAQCDGLGMNMQWQHKCIVRNVQMLFIFCSWSPIHAVLPSKVLRS